MVTLLDAMGPQIASAQGTGGCSQQTPDANCSATSNDASCNMTNTAVDESCSKTNADDNCGSKATTPHDIDQSCTEKSHDDNCGNDGKSGPQGSDADENCSASATDNNCQTDHKHPYGLDPDESCTSSGTEQDESCGDCDDNHKGCPFEQSDQHCGKPLGGDIDPDSNCGHQHLYPKLAPSSEDQVCSLSYSDVGCGVHKTKYGGTWEDDDQSCDPATDSDANCTPPQRGPAEIDGSCDQKANPSTTSPDESCSIVGTPATDEACGHYDADENCGEKGDEDQHCGWIEIAGTKYTEPDESCNEFPPDDTNSENKL